MKDLKDRQDDGQADGRLRRRQHDHEDRIDLAVEAARAEMGEGHVVDIGAVQDQLHPHQNGDGVTPRQNGVKAEAEEDGSENQVMCQTDGHSEVRLNQLLHYSFSYLREISTAPIRAASRT